MMSKRLCLLLSLILIHPAGVKADVMIFNPLSASLPKAEPMQDEHEELYVETVIQQKVAGQWSIGYGVSKGTNPAKPEWMGLVSVELEL